MNEAVIYSKKDCPFCVRAKSVLNSKKIKFVEIVYDGVTITKELVAEKIGKSEANTITFPQIFIDGEYIGGFTDLCGKLGLKAKR